MKNHFLRKLNLLLTFLLLVNVVFSQETNNYIVNWKTPIVYSLEGKEERKVVSFDNAQFNINENTLPFYVLEFKGENEYLLEKITFERVPTDEYALLSSNIISPDFEIESNVVTIQKRQYTNVRISPIRKVNGTIERLISFELRVISKKGNRLYRNKNQTFALSSKLESGNYYKIAVVKDGVYRLTPSFFKKIGVDVSAIDPRNIKIYGYGGGMLPAANDENRPDDLQENSIFVEGENDGRFDRNDYVLFYGEDQVAWAYDSTEKSFRHRLNLYSDSTFYYLTVEGDRGKRILTVPAPTVTPTAIISVFDDYGYHEKELTNLLKSGSLWLGESFDNQTSYDFQFNMPNVATNELATVEVSVFSRAGVKSIFTLTSNSQSFQTEVASTNLNRYEYRFSQGARRKYNFTPNSGVISMNLNYNKPQVVAKGWLNFITLNVRRNLIMSGIQMKFRDVNSVLANSTGNETGEFRIQSNTTIKVWDLTDKYNVSQATLINNGSQKSFIADRTTLKEYIAFTKADSTNIYAKGKVLNQNLHAQSQADLLIITHPKFMQAANRLANLHANDGLTVNVATPQQIYNEYSSGSQDLIGIRSYIKMFYDRSVTKGTPPKYVVMLGDASFDFKDRIPGNSNFVPSFQSSNSIDPVSSHVSDDYFGFLDDNEGEWRIPSNDRMDIAVGRFPVQTLAEANGIVTKIENYYAANSFGDWRNKIVFVGDDEDGVIHMSQSDDLSKVVDTKGKAFNNYKIYLDAYQQQATASGARYPKVTQDIVQAVNDGALFVNYTGHGGETGWTAERVLGVFEITNWANKDNLPIFVTATCEFSRFDDPLRTSAGEFVILNPNGGGIGLMTTTRLVFSSPNFLLNRSFYDKVFDRDTEGNPKRLGDIFLEVKNFNAYSANSRNFSLLGDPAIRMAMPKHKVVTTTINDLPISQIDTIKALSLVKISGIVADVSGAKLTNFNGFVYPTVFDKEEIKKTLNNDGGGVFTYKSRDKRIFKGKATVVNGDFTFTFVVPKDISYSYGSGKISYYTENQIEDGNGFSEDFIIGGSSLAALEDDQGPQMDLFMNDEGFVFGGITDEQPSLIVKLNDNQGINTVGSGIGHDLVAVLDDNSEKSFILNDYYEAAVDDHTSGTINYPFSELTEGKHILRVKAWDVANNSAEKSIEFTVVKDKEIKIENLVNYPNPFTTNTEFIFQHNQSGVAMDVKLDIFTISGRLVKSFDEMLVNDGFVSRDIKWDGRDEFGDRIGKGVYMYKLKIRSANGSTSEKIEKLVIL